MNSSKHKFNNQRGFSLIEAMVAITIFVIGILGAYKLQIHATQGNALADRVSAATTWATYVAEGLLAKDYDHTDLDDDDNNGMDDIDPMVMNGNADGILHFHADGTTSTNPTPPAGAIYSVYYNIAEGDPDTVPEILKDVKMIRVSVVRNGGIGNGHLYTHDYYKAKWPESE